MSKKVEFKEFCKHYELNTNDKNSKIEYQKYCENLNLVNFAISEDITKKAIKNIKQ